MACAELAAACGAEGLDAKGVLLSCSRAPSKAATPACCKLLCKGLDWGLTAVPGTALLSTESAGVTACVGLLLETALEALLGMAPAGLLAEVSKATLAAAPGGLFVTAPAELPATACAAAVPACRFCTT